MNIKLNIPYSNKDKLKKINMKISYSNTTKSYYLMNICQNCQAKQGEFFYLTK